MSMFCSPGVCGDAYSYCGLKDKLYPDKRAMGFPFDRQNPAAKLEDFTTAHPNMKTQVVQVKYNNQVIEKM